ncbi:MAG: glycosyltransferase family 39 protein [Candidatus Binatia bacterium]
MMAAQNDPRDPVGPTASKSSWLHFGALVLTFGLCGLAQWYIANGLRWSEASAVLVAGALATAVLLGRPDAEAAPRETEPLPTASDWRGAVLAAVGVGLFVYAVYRLTRNWHQSFDFAAPFAVVGVILWSAGLALWELPRGGRAGSRPMAAWELGLFLAIVAVGFFLRFYRYGDFPPPDGFCAVEEPQAGQLAYEIMRYHARPWEFLGDRWLGVAGFALLGRTVTALRIPFTIVSGLTVVALYFLLRRLVSVPAALFATALFAISRWHLIYARYAHNIFATTLLVVILYFLCVRAHQRHRLAVYPWIGFLSAYTLFTYAGYRGTSLFVFIFLAASLFIHWRAQRAAIAPQAYAAARHTFNTQLLGLALAVVAYTGVLIPLGLQLWKSQFGPKFFFEAAVRATEDSSYYTADQTEFIRHVANRALVSAMMFNHAGDDSLTFNLPGRPMLDPISGVLFTVGLAYCLIWWKYRFQGFFAFTFFVLLVMGTIFVHNFDIRRLQGIIPLIFVLVAFMSDRLWQVVIARVGPRARPALVGLAAVALGFSFRDNYDVYFHGMADNMLIRSVFQSPFSIGVRYLHKLPPNAYMLLFSDQVNFFIPSDYEWWRGTAVPGKVTADLMPILNGERGPWTGRELHLFVTDPFEHEDIARLLRERFPSAQCERLTDPDIQHHLHFSACNVPAAARTKPLEQGVRARYFRGSSDAPLLERFEPAIGYALFPDICRLPIGGDRGPCRAEWEGAWEVSEPGIYQFQAAARNGAVTMTVDDQPVDGPLNLTAGPHRIRVQARFQSAEEVGAQVRWRNGPHQWELLQFATLQPATP